MKRETCGCMLRRGQIGAFIVGALSLLAVMATLGISVARAGDGAAQPADQTDVDKLLSCGEFGAAADAARQTDGPNREQMLKRVIMAQIQSGDDSGAQTLITQTGEVRERKTTTGKIAQNPVLNGGTQADFTALINLIQNQTNGKWESKGDGDGTIDRYQNGVRVDPQGVLARISRSEERGQLAALSGQARVAALNDDMSRQANLRLVSLTRLEKEVARRLAEGKPVVESMRQLAGLSQVRYLFVYPEDGEIVIGGPAEGWRYNEQGVSVGVNTGRPTLQLDDLVTVLRTFSPAGRSIFGCSIDPQIENLKAVKAFATDSQAQGPLSPAQVKVWANKIEKILGLQDVTVFGVPANSRVARVMVETDYRMKLIGVGQLEGGSNIPSYFEILAKHPEMATGGLDAMRWWLTMRYEAVLNSPDQSAFEIRGSAVQCLSENQFLTNNGQHVSTGKAEPINQQFAANLTQHYQELAQRDPSFADLQGIFDLSLAAALIQQDQLDQKANWERGVFDIDGAYRPATYSTPRQAESVVNYKVYNGQDVVLQAAGGVRGDVLAVLRDVKVRQESPRVGVVAEAAKAQDLPEGRWWWDAK